jgi:hypothetical protein
MTVPLVTFLSGCFSEQQQDKHKPGRPGRVYHMPSWPVVFFLIYLLCGPAQRAFTFKYGSILVLVALLITYLQNYMTHEF